MVGMDETSPPETGVAPAVRLFAAIQADVERQLREPLSAGLHVCATPIGNLGDMTVRGITTLARADIIYCEDTRHSRVLLSHYGIDRPLRPYHEHNAAAERPRILSLIAAGKAIALISDAGTPLISDPGYKLVREAVDAGYAVTALPGASAVLTALTLAGLPTDTFLFAGFLPPKGQARRTRLAELASVPATLVMFEAPTRIASTIDDIRTCLPGRPVAVARELTKRFEEILRGTADDIAARLQAAPPKGEIVLLVGPPSAVEVTDADIEAELRRMLADMSLRDAVRAVADGRGLAKSRVYDIGLSLKDRAE
jgi:16S rRNA (cytidine1402-2'-O)-methyltransferase